MQYRRLLLSAGGGVVNPEPLAPQKNTVTIAIGLGGTGIACLRSLKRQVYSQLQPDDPKADVPSYSHIKFLAVDMDKDSLAPNGQIYDLNEATEYFDISSRDIERLLEMTVILAGKPEYKWLKNSGDKKGQGGLRVLRSGWGITCGVRQIGRLLIFEKARSFVDDICRLVNEAKAGLPNGVDVNIHIFSGMGGGTGSGIFLDVCYLVQKALEEIGEAGHALTCGYFFLPDVNLSNPIVAASPPVSTHIKANSFAAMKELDYCMNFFENHGSWDQEYCGFHIGPTQEPPIKLCHLISAATTDGAVLEDGFTYAMNVVTNYVMQFIVESQGFTLQSRILTGTAFAMANTVLKRHGAYHNYCILGAAQTGIPLTEINTYLSSKFFQGIEKIQQQMPSNAEIEAFANDIGLSFNSLFQSILDRTSYQMPSLELDDRLYRDMPEDDLALPDELHLPHSILTPYHNMEQNMLGRIETNKKALLHAWRKENIKEERCSISKMCRVYYALSDIVGDGAKGPMYAAAILGGRKNIVDMLRGALTETQNALSKERRNIELRFATAKNARTAFLHPRIFQSRARLFDDFLVAVQQYKSLDCKIKALMELESMIRIMIDQMQELYGNHFKVYAQICQNLIDTFHENYCYLTNEKQVAADPFVIPLVTVDDLKDSLDKTVASMNLDQANATFHATFFANHEAWLANDEQKISKAVSSYLTELFSDYTSKNLTDYLELRFGTNDPAQLSGLVYRDILKPLVERAKPLFWVSEGFDIADLFPVGCVTVPEGNTPVVAVGELLASTCPGLHCTSSRALSSLGVTWVMSGIPMYAYADIDRCMNAYNSSPSVGKHLYEETSRDPRDWRLLHNLVPLSRCKTPDAHQLECSREYDLAVERHIICRAPDHRNAYRIVGYPELTELKNELLLALETSDEAIREAAKEKLVHFIKNREIVSLIQLSGQSALGCEATVRKDSVVASIDLMAIIRRELAKADELRQLAEAFQVSMEACLPEL